MLESNLILPAGSIAIALCRKTEIEDGGEMMIAAASTGIFRADSDNSAAITETGKRSDLLAHLFRPQKLRTKMLAGEGAMLDGELVLYEGHANFRSDIMRNLQGRAADFMEPPCVPSGEKILVVWGRSKPADKNRMWKEAEAAYYSLRALKDLYYKSA